MDRNEQKIGTIDRLIGDDALVLSLDLDTTELVGDGTETLKELNTKEDTSDGSLYVITGKASTASIFTTLAIGQPFYSPKGEEVMKIGDKCKPYIEHIMADAKNISISITSSEVNVTVLKDDVSKYRRGKGDATGSMSFQTMVSQMTEGGMHNQFLKVCHVAVDGKQALLNVSSRPIFIKSYLQKQGHGETQVFLLAQIELFGITLGADMGAAQEYTSNLRFIGDDPILYVVETERA